MVDCELIKIEKKDILYGLLSLIGVAGFRLARGVIKKGKLFLMILKKG